jgi:signal transduction histidine kinase
MMRPAIARDLSVLGFALSCAILAFVGATSYQRLAELRDASRSVEHTHEVRSELERILSLLTDAETGQRGFLLTGVVSYLEPYNAALAALPARLERLRTLTVDNPRQQERLAALDALIRRKAAELSATIVARETRGLELAARIVITDEGKRLMDQIRTLVNAMGAEEGRLLTERSQREDRVGRTAIFTTLAGVGLAMVLAVAATMLLNRAIRERGRADAARVAAEAADRAKDEFLAVLSHELRTPLTSIVGWIRMLRAGHLSEPDRLRALEVIERSAQLQAALINDLLDISRFMRSGGHLDLHGLDLTPTIEAAVNSVRTAAEGKGVKLDCALGASSTSVMGDPNRLQQIVTNLLTNAIKFTPAGGLVTISLQRDDRWAHIVVSDTGKGISADFLPHIFESFRQGEAARGQGGLGLGLAIVRRLVELHGGTVQAQSAGEGTGAVFTVILPVIDPTPPDEPQ